ncbi:hypothetical protein WMO43_08350 [Lachnospiraceae bacterium CLA-AA-H185]|uniref:Leucine-rich repeat domain-containing protein n=1 Tax=Maccoyibacter intestinihominis TaxID=3133499 RepID=A0ABV1HF39_9FIRM
MYKPTRHSYEKRMKNQRRKAKAGLLLATTLTAGMAVNPCPAVTGLASYLTGTGNVSVVQAAETLSISKENVTKIDLGKQEDKIDEDCVILTLDHDGTYILMGQNYMNDTWVDTQIQVPEGVTVNLILAEDFSIQNDDGAYVWNSGYWSGKSLTPFVIQGTANLYVDDTVKIHNSVSDKNYEGNTTHEFYRGLFRVDGTMTIKEVKDGAKIKLEQDVNNKAQWGAGYYDEESREYKCINDIPAVFEGTGTVILKEGTFDGTEISYPRVREGSEFKQGEAVTDNKITSKVAHLIIRGGNYNNIEIHKERVVDKYTVAGGTLEVEEGTFAKIDGEYVLDSCSVKTPADADEDFSVAMTNHDYGAADYSWSADKSTCTASRICQKDKTHIETETATATSVITKRPTCTTAGERTYKAEFKNAAFATQTQTEAVAKKGHKYAAPTYSWSADKSTCTASRICQKDKTHVETEKATVTSAVTTQPTYEKTGVRTYTAAFKNAAFSTQTQTETIAKRVKPQENIQTKTSIKKASVSGISNKNYNGKSQKQSIKVKLGKKTLKQGTDYAVSYKNNKNIGKATVTIKGKGKYEGSIKKTFQITVAKGKTYTAGNFKYKMTKASTNGKGTVTLAATKKSKSDKKFTSCKIADTVKIGGKTFKVTAIGDDAFKGYKKLKTITIESKNIESVGKNAVKNIHKEATIKVPKNKVKEYKKLFNKNTGFTSKMMIKKA